MMTYWILSILLCFVVVRGQLRRNQGPSVVVILPPGLQEKRSNAISVAVNGGGEISVKIFDASVMLKYTRATVSSGVPTRIEIPPFSSNSSSFELRVDVKSSQGQVFYSNTFHIPKIGGTTETILETDKPVYRPMETVRFRILTLAYDYQLNPMPVVVFIKNPDQLVVWREVLTANKNMPFVKSSFKLPQHLAEGRWRILVKDQSTDTLLVENRFDVLHYDLPKFEVLAVANTSSYVTGFENVDVLVFARSATGRQVSGTLAVVCSADQQRELILQTTQIRDGTASVSFNLQRCWSGLQKKSEPWRVPASINIRVEVRDYEIGEKQFSSVQLFHHTVPYSIKLLPSRPGLISAHGTWNFSAPCLVTVQQANGIPAQGIPIRATVDCILKRNLVNRLHSNTSFGLTNENGEILISVYFQQDCSALIFQVYTADPQLDSDKQGSSKLLLPSFNSDSSLVLDINTLQVKTGGQLRMQVRPFKSSRIDFTTRILAVSASDVLGHSIVNSSHLQLQLPIGSEMIPEFVLILYHVEYGSTVATVDDVLRIFVTHDCKSDEANININGKQQLHQPGSNVTLRLIGKKGGFVATKAIDRKLAQLVRQIRLEQNLVKSRNKDALKRLLENKTLDGFDFDQKLNKTVDTCCLVGRIWWQINADCTDFPPAPYSFLDDCRRAFTSCCSGIEPPRADLACQRGQAHCRITVAGSMSISPRMHLPKASVAMTPELLEEEDEEDTGGSSGVRSYFPEVWLFDELKFGNYGYVETQITLPHSITNWTITGHFWNPTSPMCPAETEIITDLSTFMEIDLPSTVYVGDQILAKVIINNYQAQSKNVRLDVTRPNGLCSSGSISDRQMSVNANSSTALTVPFEFLRGGSYEIEFTLIDYVLHGHEKQVDKIVKVIQALEREKLDSSLEYNFSWDLSSMDDTQKWINDTILAYKFDRTKISNSAQIKASVYLTQSAISDLKIDRMIAQFTPLAAAKRARWSKIRISDETASDLMRASMLNEILLRAPSVLQAVEDIKESQSTVPNPQLVQASQLLHLCLMETLSFRGYNGAYSPYRMKDPEVSEWTPGSLWLTAMATALHCRTGMDSSVVCPSLVWILAQQQANGGFKAADSADFTNLNNENDNQIILTSFTLMTMRVCSDYGAKCWSDNGKKQYGVLTKALSFLARVDYKKSEPLVLGSLTLAFAAWRHPFARPVNDALLKLLEEGADYPYWTYKPQLGGWLSRMKHGAQGWFSAEYRRKMLSSQITLNCMGLLAQLTLGNPRNINLEQIGLWLIEHRKRDGVFVSTLDTLLASRALIELHRSLGESDSNVVTKISVKCQQAQRCPSVLITPQNSEVTQTLELKIDNGGLTFLVTGKGAVYVKFQLIGKEPLQNPDFYPVQMTANTTNNGSTNFTHDLCFQTNDDTMNSLVIEHTFSSGLVYVDGSFTQTKGDAKVLLIEPTSYSIHILFADIRKNQEQCYTFGTRLAGLLVYSLRRPIVARHASLGIIGMILSSGQNQGSQVPLLEKYCPSNSSQCICAEALCPPPTGECSTQICTDNHVDDVLKALCNVNNTGCLVKIVSVEEERVSQIVYNRLTTVRHLPLSPNPADEECKNLDVLVRKSCRCPSLVEGDIYVLVIRNDALKETTMRNFRPTVLVGEHGFFEPYFACSATKHSDIHKFVQENQRRAICASLTPPTGA